MALTPAENAALAAGYPMPEGGDRISDGDDAIRTAGVTAHQREFRRPDLTGTVTLDNLTQPGYHPIPSRAVATAIGAPADFQAQGGVYVDVTGWSGASGPILMQTLWAYTRDYKLTRTRLSNGAFGSWESGILRSDLGTSVGNTMRLSRWLAENPAVYTSGRGAVAFTFDHGLTKFKSAGLPGVLDGYGWGYGLALNDGTLSAAENSGASDADILSWAGAEIWNHGYNHSSTKNEQNAKTIVVQGKTALEARFGREVFGFIPAGVGPTGLAGFDGGSSPEMFATTIAGQMILEHHAVTTGYMGAGGVRQLDGRVQQGIGRFTMDEQTVSRIKQQIDKAINERVGVMFMCHPSLLDTAGNLTTSQLLEVLAYARQREQAGELAVLSPGELARADAALPPGDAASTSHTHHRLDNPHGHLGLDASGGFQHRVGGTRVWWVNGTGELVEGSIPWERITGALEKVWQADIPTATGWRTDVMTEVKAYRNGSVVTVSAWRLAHDVGDEGDVLAYTLPLGYRPAGLTQQYTHDSRDANVRLLHAGEVRVTNPSAIVAHHSLTFVTLDPLPV